MLRPIVSMIVFTFVFDTMLGAARKVFHEVYAFAGLLPWELLCNRFVTFFVEYGDE